jgi:DNA-binding SARP family transcriptional activator/tetratricopeptide (TPR) repeat protein
VVPVAYAFQLNCLGSPSLLSASGEQVRFRTRKHFALLVRLALEPGKRFTRDYLTDLLWPSAAPRLGNHSLAQGLSVIKAKVAREAVLIQRATVGLAPGWVDVDVLHLGNGDVGIGGPFLDGFDIPAARPFEEWKDESRARLLPQVRDCLVRQMDAARRIGDFATVERRAERLQELDPLAEEAIRGVMEARAWAGDRSNAIKAFVRYESQLAEELGAKPGADLVRMADLLRDGRRPSPRPGGGAPEAATPGSELMARRFEPETLIGREREFSVLYDAWIEARRKTPRIVVVTSDPGVGKTTLANAFVSSCQMDGAVVARAQAYDAERELPFAVLGELVKQLASQRAIGGADPEALSELTRITTEIARVFPGVPKPVDWSPEITPLRLADAFLKTVTAAAENSPVVLVVDDIHAADNASTAILHVVARKLADVRVLMILTGRTSELRLSGAPAALTSDSSIEGLRALEVDVLPAEAAERLVRQLAAAAEQPDPPTDRILRVSGGNPLALELLTREWAAHGPSSLLRDLEALNTQPVPTLGIPRAIGAVFDRQSRRLDPTTRAALDLAAVLGRRVTDLALYAAVDLSPGRAAGTLSRLKDNGLLREVRGDLEFRNELIRAQAYYAVAGPARQHLHRRVGELLAARPPLEDKAVSLEIAWHFLRGGAMDEAVSHAIAGADSALQCGAPLEAERVLKVLSGDRGHECVDPRIPVLLARALVNQSKADAALPILASILQKGFLVERDRAEVLYLQAAAVYLRGQDGSRYGEFAAEALSAALTTAEADLIARSAFEYARSGVVSGDTERIRHAVQQIDSALERDDLQSNPMIYHARCYSRFFCHDAFAALEDIEKALRLHQGTPNIVEQALLHNAHGVCLRSVCRTGEANDAFEIALALSLRIGDDSRASIVSANLGMVDNSRGRFESALAHGTRASEYARSDVNQPLRTIVYVTLMESCALLGRFDEAKKWMDLARGSMVEAPTMINRLTFYLEAAGFALMIGNVRLALSLTEEAEEAVQGQDLFPQDAGIFARYRAFRAVHMQGIEPALDIVKAAVERFERTHPLYYVNVLPAKAWIEQMAHGCYSKETEDGLRRLSDYDLDGKRATWRAQGFLT